jgi:hypothetical protein
MSETRNMFLLSLLVRSRYGERSFDQVSLASVLPSYKSSKFIRVSWRLKLESGQRTRPPISAASRVDSVRAALYSFMYASGRLVNPNH